MEVRWGQGWVSFRTRKGKPAGYAIFRTKRRMVNFYRHLTVRATQINTNTPVTNLRL